MRAEIAAEVGTPVKVFVPQTRLPGAEGEVDWGQFDAVIAGQTVTFDSRCICSRCGSRSPPGRSTART